MEKKRSDTEETINELAEVYKEQLREMFKNKGKPLTFTDIENIVDGGLDETRGEVIGKIVEKEIEERLHKGINPEETSVCVCGTEVAICRDKQGKVKTYERTIQTKRGAVKLKEFGYYCPKCRKVFFPSEKRAKVIQGKLQP